MKPAWDKLSGLYKDSPTLVVADVDCTSEEGKPLCSQYGVRGFPTIKYKDESGEWQAYESGRDFDSLKAHAETLGPSCSPDAVELCSAEQVALIDSWKAKGKDAINEEVQSREQRMEESQKNFDKTLEGLQAKYDEAKKQNDDTIAEAKSGLGLLKAIANSL